MNTIQLGDFAITLQRSSRRQSIGLQVKHGQVKLYAPAHVCEKTIVQFIKHKQTWIEKHLLQQQAVVAQQSKPLVIGSTVLWLGQHKVLTVLAGHSSANYVDEQQLVLHFSKTRMPSITADCLTQHVKRFYQQQAQRVLSQRLAMLAELTNLEPSSYKIRYYKARWGSCNNRGEVSLNYLLMMTPEFVIDYVIIHELCHLVHLNHSASFWTLVAKYCPDYKQAKQWLKTHQSQLTIK